MANVVSHLTTAISSLLWAGTGAPYGTDKASYLTVAKLTAILRLANSLDRSHKQKMKGVKAVLQENELILKVDTQEDITLEKGFFQTSTEFFKKYTALPR